MSACSTPAALYGARLKKGRRHRSWVKIGSSPRARSSTTRTYVAVGRLAGVTLWSNPHPELFELRFKSNDSFLRFVLRVGGVLSYMVGFATTSHELSECSSSSSKIGKGWGTN